VTHTIWKFPLAITDEQRPVMPVGAEPLTVQMQDGELAMWARVDPGALQRSRAVYVYGTGQPAPRESAAYLGTVQQFDGKLVWHVFVEADL